MLEARSNQRLFLDGMELNEAEGQRYVVWTEHLHFDEQFEPCVRAGEERTTAA